MSQFVLKPVIKSLLTNPPPFEVWKNTLLYKLLPQSTYIKHTPISLVVYTTKRCNFKCEFCFTYEDLNKPNWKSFELNSSEFSKILDSQFGRQALRIGFLGGEPFLNPLLFDFLDEAHNRGKITTIVSNASLINDKLKNQLLTHYPTMLGLSLYDNNQDQVLELSQWLAKNKKYFWVQSVVAADELDQLEKKINFASQANIKNLILSNYNPVHSGRVEKTIFEDNADFIKLTAEAKKMAQALKIDLTLPQPIQRNPVKRNCQMPFSYIHLDNSGEIGACCFRAPTQKYGNIFKENTWNNSEHQELRSTFLDNKKAPLPECRYCENFSRDLYGGF